MRIAQMTALVGAEVLDIELDRLTDSDIAVLRAALLEHKVLFFPEQRLDHRSHLEFACRFGQLTAAHPLVDTAADPYPEILPVDNLANERQYGTTSAERRRTKVSSIAAWHTDLTPLANPPAICVLRAQTVPEFGGDTHWANLAAAYAALSPRLKSLLETLHAEHRYLAGYQASVQDTDDYKRSVAAKPLAAVHPVVRRHPETGEPVLFVNPLFTARIVELSAAESSHVLAMLFEQLSDPAYAVRFRWRPGSVAMWDNRATAHAPPADLLGGVDRVLYRVSIVGDVPVSVSGEPSYALAGDPWPARISAQATESAAAPRS